MMQNQLVNGQGLAGVTIKVPFRRELNTSDLERMRIPRRYWMARFDMLSDDGGDDSLKSMVGRYISNMSEMRKAGGGFVFFGDNSVGKTCASVVLAKELRRRGNTVLFVESADLKNLVIGHVHFDEDDTYWDRAKNVDVLVLDDLGKGTHDTKGLGASLIDELISSRNSSQLVTIITSNLSPEDWEEELGLKTSTIHTLKECAIPVQVTGSDQRKSSNKKLRELLNSN